METVLARSWRQTILMCALLPLLCALTAAWIVMRDWRFRKELSTLKQELGVNRKLISKNSDSLARIEAELKPSPPRKD